MDNYLKIEALSKDEFYQRRKDLSKDPNATLTPPEDITRTERLLDLSEGLLKDRKLYLSESNCACGRRLTFLDFVFTALAEQWHTPSFIVHTLIGSKYFVNVPRKMRCIQCGRVSTQGNSYDSGTYACCGDGW